MRLDQIPLLRASRTLTGVFPSRGQAEHDRGRISGIEGEIVGQGIAIGEKEIVIVLRATIDIRAWRVGIQTAEEPPPAIGDFLDRTGGEAFELQPKETRSVFHPFQVAVHPVERICDPGKYHGASSSMIQASLEPPPWLEFTTRLPLRSATRHSPRHHAGLLPVQHEGSEVDVARLKPPVNEARGAR